MNEINDFKKAVLKKIKELQYKNKKLTQLTDGLTKQNKIVNDWLSISRSKNTKLISDNFKLKKIIAGQKRKIEEEGFVETDEEIEMPLFLNTSTSNIKIEVTGKKIKP